MPSRSSRTLAPCGPGLRRLSPHTPRRSPASAGTMDSEAFQSTRDLLDLNFQCELG